ncbi:MAG: hypothetical protein JRJ09_12430 [Deltaproteobacteria bacterium]|nr:hypothetical protein [Deltaproteobacteria bacterium]MBW2049314.1 hypothetical protein [Deltaproteobacteria bacterium]MBW2110080.1 hypothetical protein [Deltaproteobacteria bacterium]MBW2352963.1 hypothetical protein [Deltaproteobacteria bacterium]HDZ91639.1 hypothetical protein [Deltaproteobacteria bacterium]
MKCDEFWDRWADLPERKADMPGDMKEHLKACSTCSLELSLVQQGLEELRQEIEEEESARFWHGLRQGVRAGIMIPRRRFPLVFSWQKIGWVAAGVVLLFLMFRGFPPHPAGIHEEDVLLLTGLDPMTVLYTGPESLLEDADDEFFGSDLFRGITDGWTSLLDQAATGAIVNHGDGDLPGQVMEKSRTRGRWEGFCPKVLISCRQQLNHLT